MSRVAAIAPALLLAACVADPLAPVVDLATESDLATRDAVVDLAADASTDLLADASLDLDPFDVAAPPDLNPPTSDLIAWDPTWIDSNSTLDGANLRHIAVTIDTIYVATNYDVYRTTNQGASFTRVPFDWSDVGSGIRSLTARNGRVYLGLDQGRILQLEGTTVHDLTSSEYGGSKPATNLPIGQLAAHPTSSDETIYASDGENVYEFVQSRGTPWAVISSHASFPMNDSVRGLRVGGSGIVYVSGTDGLITWSGSSWSLDTTPGAYPRELDVRGSASSLQVPVITMSGDIVVLDGGVWNTTIADLSPIPSHISVGNDGSLIAAAATELRYLSAFDTMMWTTVHTEPQGFAALARSLDGTQLYAIGSNGMYVATTVSPADGINRKLGLHGLTVHAFAASPVFTSVVYAGTDRGVFRSPDFGATWTTCNDATLPASANIDRLALAIDTGLTEVVYAISNNQLFRSENSGATWIDVAQQAHQVATDYNAGSFVYVCSGSRAEQLPPRVSSNRGDSFNDFSGPTDCDALALSQGTLTITSEGHYWRSVQPQLGGAMTDAGIIANGPTVAMLTLVPRHDSDGVIGIDAATDPSMRELYLLGASGVTKLMRPTGIGRIYDLATSPVDAEHVLIGSSNGVFFGSISGPHAIERKNTGLAEGNVFAVGRSPHYAVRTVAGVEERGVYRSQ